MKLRKIFNIIVNDKIVSTSFSHKLILDEFREIIKSEPKAYIQECYA